MATYCSGKSKAILTYTKPNKEKKRYEFNKVPIEINILNSGTPGSYRFYGTGDDKVFYQFIASGINPGYRVNSGFNGRGLTPTMNGVFIQPEYYYYVSGSGIETLVQSTQSCQIQVTGSGNDLTDAVECPNGNYKVSCDDGCPDGFIRCVRKEYPGYCCMPCKDTGDRLKNIANKVGL